MLLYLRKLNITIIIFCFIFSFYIIGPITSAILVGLAITPYFIIRNRRRFLIEFTYSSYTKVIFGYLIFLIALGIIYSLCHQTYDLSYVKLIFGQIIHFAFGTIIVCFILHKYRISTDCIIQHIILAFILQAIIEVFASFIPSLATFLLYFNHADSLLEGSSGVRGLALSSATGWSLGLSFGVTFILYTQIYLRQKIKIIYCFGWITLIIGTFFAGRTGLVGAAFGMLFLLVSSHKSVVKALKFLLIIIIIFSLVFLILYILFKDYVEYMIVNVLPFALEPVFNYLDGKGLSSRSTDILDTMWDRPVTDKDIIFGSGNFTGKDGAYYMHTDVGVLRNIYYWGIGGYAILIMYQLSVLYPIVRTRKYHLMAFVLLVFLCFAEYKAMTIGVNKMVMSIVYLLGATQYINITLFKKHVKNFHNNTRI